jgi:hypothetical protein
MWSDLRLASQQFTTLGPDRSVMCPTARFAARRLGLAFGLALDAGGAAPLGDGGGCDA